jgi:hypothetical protein
MIGTDKTATNNKNYYNATWYSLTYGGILPGFSTPYRGLEDPPPLNGNSII